MWRWYLCSLDDVWWRRSFFVGRRNGRRGRAASSVDGVLERATFRICFWVVHLKTYLLFEQIIRYNLPYLIKYTSCNALTEDLLGGGGLGKVLVLGGGKGSDVPGGPSTLIFFSAAIFWTTVYLCFLICIRFAI